MYSHSLLTTFVFEKTIILVNYRALLLKAFPPATCSSIIKQVIFSVKESSRLLIYNPWQNEKMAIFQNGPFTNRKPLRHPQNDQTEKRAGSNVNRSWL